MICEYGCGQEAKHQFKNGKWCCSKNHACCPVFQKRQSSLRAKARKLNGLPWHSEQTKINISESKRGKPNLKLKGRKFSEIHRQNLSKAHSGMKKPWVAEATRKWYSSMTDKEKKDHYLKSRVNTNEKGQNGFEESFDLATHSNIVWIGDFQKQLKWKDGRLKYPDFEVLETPKLIELFGHGWHSKEEEKIYKREYKKIGYDCLIIWDTDWNKNQSKILKNLDRFIGA